MPYLKQKIGNARRNMPTMDFSEDDEESQGNIKTQLSSISVKIEPQQKPAKSEPKKVAQSKQESKKNQSKPSSKNIVKNFGKAMCSFASSPLALPYLERVNPKGEVNIDDFQDHIHRKRDLIDSIDSLRSLLLINEHDSDTIVGFKKIFKEISIIFIKYFSVNWIFQGKMSHKQAHLNARFKMLRRIKSPQHFTYFKDFSR